MTKLLNFIFFAVFIIGCGPKKEKDPEPAPTEIHDTTLVDPQHTSENSLDYLGRYKGKIGSDETAIELSEGFTYLTATTDASGKKRETKGSFKWNPQGDGIVLDANQKQTKSFFVGEGFIALLGSDGQRLNPANSGAGILHKQNEVDAAKSDGTPMDRLPQTLTGIHWKLSEIKGRPFAQSANKDFYIQFTNDAQFSAFAGCNRMGGKYELKGSKVRLFRIISTMMACPDMTLEDEFKKALEISDNYVANEKVLQLRKGGSNLLKFEAFDLPQR